ncbi:MAG: hypothetical protein R6X29_06020 [Acidimicrobiia bacterium]
MRSRLLALTLAAALLTAACTTLQQAPETTTTASATATSGADSTTTTSQAPETTTTTAGPLSLPPGTEGLPEATRRQIAELIRATEQARDLEFLELPTITVLDPVAFEERVRSLILEEAEDVPADEALFELLGLIEPGTDLLALYADLYGEQVAGFYDGESGEMVIPATGTELTALEGLTLVHELVHALTDQHFGFHGVWQEMIDGQDFDRASAYLALIEGDATLAEIEYLRGLPTSEQLAIISDSAAFTSDVFEGAPPFLQQSLLFPYTQGVRFTQTIYGRGGWEEVNATYANGPASTEQILDPAAFGREEPLPVALPSLADPAGYERVFESVWGQLGFELMFGQVLDDATTRQAAGGWGGDAYAQWFDGQESAALALRYVGDTPRDAVELAAALEAYVVAAMLAGNGTVTATGTVFERVTYAWVALDGDEVWFVAASDPAVGRELTAQIAGS